MGQKYSVAIVGSGHNALVAACYLAKAGKKVLVLEKNNYIGGATTSQKIFDDFEVNLSKYAYLVSLFPEQIMEELGLEIELISRKIASYTPYKSDGGIGGLLISNVDQSVTKRNIDDLGIDENDWQGYQDLLQMGQDFAAEIWDSMLLPLKSFEAWKNHFEEKGKSEIWEAFVEKPIGAIIEEKIKSDVLRGVLLTDAKIGSYTSAHDPSLLQNRTYIYHIIGQKTGEWRVPKGGMGNIAKQLQQKAESLGVEFRLNSAVTEIIPGANIQRIVLRNGTRIESDFVLLNAAMPGFTTGLETEQQIGTAFKINLLLKKLPQLKDQNVKPEDAFCGTFHIDQNYSQQEIAFLESASGIIPTTFPCEIYCHSMTDGSILSEELLQKGYHTLTVFGLDMAYPLFEKDNVKAKEIVVQKFFNGINQYLATPLEECLAKDKHGGYCLEAKSAYDLEQELGMPKGNIFHNQLSWFYAENEEEIGKMGVETHHPKIFICGSSAKRGGAVSGIPGRNAAMVVLNMLES